ncbi:hypothetical protein ELE36_00230 [Pseudolysobacter antarcticus]|uniref:Uncharacterized protein n=1 Tax=Pseudolysobacter antarcticus TaxID=2511995 RepID=A0A411HEP0_9GAMM|nr:hypothetical protein [Pseudolysobacter antarcticus]QBB68929.1 hypothetical protein ELE36_00230 [Pseudolysobacter antarcticus]
MGFWLAESCAHAGNRAGSNFSPGISNIFAATGDAMTQTFGDFLDTQGDLHDCEVRNMWWDIGSSAMEISLVDANANFLGLPEYIGPMPGRICFNGVQSIDFQMSHAEPKLSIYEANFYLDGEYSVTEFRFSPSGKIVIRCRSIHFHKVNVDGV